MASARIVLASSPRRDTYKARLFLVLFGVLGIVRRCTTAVHGWLAGWLLSAPAMMCAHCHPLPCAPFRSSKKSTRRESL